MNSTDTDHSDHGAVATEASPGAKAQALVLAAGRGERMRPLTDATPKPLLEVRGRPLLAWHLSALARAGLTKVCINTAWLEEQIPARLGRVWREDCGPNACAIELCYSHEGRDFGAALDTAGGIVRALPGLGDVFWLVAGDVFTPDFAFDQQAMAGFAASPALAHLWLVPNPEHHQRGDFGLSPDGLALNLPAGHPGPRYTYSTVGLYKQALFGPPLCAIATGNPQGVKAALAPLLRKAMDQGLVSAEIYRGAWTDVGTPERLAQLG